MDPSNNYKTGMYPEVNYGPPQQLQPMGGYSQPQPMGYTNQGAQQSSSHTTVIVQQPVQQNSLMVANVKGHRDWTSGLCDCSSDIGVCCFTCCCYSRALCQMATRTGECCCTTLCVPGADINIRTRIRTLGGIKGSMCNDCCVVCFCSMCAACQELRELTAMGIP